jgi:hypothetical protein
MSLLLLLIPMACSGGEEAVEADPPADPSLAKAADAAPTATEGTVDVCGTPWKIVVTPPTGGASDFRFAARDVGPVAPGASLSAASLTPYGWAAELPDEQLLLWYDLDAGLSPEAFIEAIQPDFHCEGLGGHGLVKLEGGAPVSVTLRDPRFQSADGLKIGASDEAVRASLCGGGCEEQENLLAGGSWLTNGEGISASLNDEGQLYELSFAMAGGAAASGGKGDGDSSGERSGDQSGGKSGGKGGKSGKGRR